MNPLYYIALFRLRYFSVGGWICRSSPIVRHAKLGLGLEFRLLMFKITFYPIKCAITFSTDADVVLNYFKFFTSQAFKLSGNPFPLICIGVKLKDQTLCHVV